MEHEVKRALDLLEGDRSEQYRYTAVLVLRELAEHTPTLFNLYVGEFLDHIWVALRDPKDTIRDAAIRALRACLTLIAKRDNRFRNQWYEKLFSEVQQVLCVCVCVCVSLSLPPYPSLSFLPSFPHIRKSGVYLTCASAHE